MYDFSQLSPADFEELTRDLLQKHWGVTLESFRSGRDAGIDLRYAVDYQKTIIIQCKHYLGSGFRKLRRDLEDNEKPKLAQLSSDRYVVVTSVPLNPREKDDIASAMQPYVRAPGDVIGQETLNNLLRQYPEIEQRHFKLWLSSTPVLSRVLHNAEHVQTDFNVERVCRAIPLYVQNSGYTQALKILDEQRFVIISGVPGIGKTTLADLLLFTHLESSFEPVVIQSDIADGRRLFSNERKQIFYFDDFLGETFLGSRFDFVGRREDTALLDFMELIKRSKHSRLILTTREHILRQAFDISERFQRGKEKLSVHRCVLELASYTLIERGRILYNHIYFSDLPGAYKAELLRDRFYMNILKHRNYNPRLVEWLSKYTNIRRLKAGAYRDEVLRVLDDPTYLWRTAYERQISDAARSLLLALYSLGGEASRRRLETAWRPLHRARIERYRISAAPEDWRKSLQDLEGGFLAFHTTRSHRSPPEVSFINPSVKDFFDGALAADSANLEDLLASATYFDQIVQLWALFDAKSSGAPQMGQHTAAFIAAADRLALQPHRLHREGEIFGMSGWSKEDALPEIRLNTIMAMAEHTRLAQALDLTKRYAEHLLAHWQSHSPDFAAAVAGLRVLDNARWQALKDSNLQERLKTALLDEAEVGVGSSDLMPLIAYADHPGARWFVEDDARLGALCDHYLTERFGEELRDCASESELSTLDDAVSRIAGRCGVSDRIFQEEIAEHMVKYEDPDIDDNDRPSSSWTHEPSGSSSEAMQEAEVIRLFDGLK